MVSDETLEGLGTVGFIFQALFGTLVKLASQPPIPLKPPKPPETLPPENPITPDQNDHETETATMQSKQAYNDDYEATVMQFEEEQALDSHEIRQVATKTAKSKLTEYLPHPGYFLAGAVSGGVLRTITAPLDRLKVFLLVNTKARDPVAALGAAKHGHPIVALRSASGPIFEAMTTLWKTGGFRTFFAGKAARGYSSGGRESLTYNRKWTERNQDHARIGHSGMSPVTKCGEKPRN